ncbi:VWA domain-containing protein [Microlunatus parietis]|uniref:Ca-activated chloride channel family protein n=1 Tax=Microlunatus parietis TaxID=682979 RepID=A0A7Y9I7M8_9ACTN|nr:VWA domain-containing protein [Microlunatus parietis]NYE71816.1 Ca-activated chloride channel family protein [Microlunatus parietis]
MTFLSPLFLLILIPVAGLAVGYVLMQRRRRRYAVRFAALPMLDKVVPKRPGWRRHLPATLILVALVALGLAAARPELALRVPYDRATVIVAVDISGSMAATDVSPNRLSAAKSAAAAFVADLPETVNVGVVTFAGSSTVVAAPTTDHESAQRQIESLTTAGGGTAIGEAVFSSIDQVARLAAEEGAEGVPARVVLLSDGDNSAGRDPGQAARAAAESGLPVSTIAYGTPDGVLQNGRGVSQPVPVDEEALRELAQQTGGTAYTAASGEELAAVYSDIGSSIGWRVEPREITPYLAAGSLIIVLVAGAFSLRWFARIV